MASPTQKQQEIRELIRLSEASRARIGQVTHELKAKFDLPARLGGFVKSNPLGIIGGSLLAGLAASFLFRSRKPAALKEAKKRGIAASLLLLALTAARPVAKIYISKLLKNYLTARLKSGSTKSRPTRNFHPI